MYWGWHFVPNAPGPERQMHRPGDKLEYNSHEFGILAADYYRVQTDRNYTSSSHQDADDAVSSTWLHYDTTGFLCSIWDSPEGNATHGAMNRNFLRTGGSVFSRRMEYYDDDFGEVPDWLGDSRFWSWLPAECGGIDRRGS